jgi:MSHA pilin protein MshA
MQGNILLNKTTGFRIEIREGRESCPRDLLNEEPLIKGEKNKMKTLQNQKGFTLIELIVVIVILGILAVVAIPKYGSLTKDADYAVVKGVVGALNSAATLKFAYNRLAAETGHGTVLLMTTPTLLGAELDPAFNTTDYPKWTIDALTFVYTSSSTWTCTLTPETATARAKIALPAY